MYPLNNSGKAEYPTFQEDLASTFFKLLPQEIVRLIFLDTDARTLAKINCVSSRWQTLSSDDFIWNEVIVNELILKGYRDRVFAPSDWNISGRYPRNLCKELDNNSPYYEGKKVGETSLVVFKNPKIQNCKELEKWAEKNGAKKAYKVHSRQISDLECEQSLSSSEWLLIPDGGVVPKSRRKSLGEQRIAIEKKDGSYRLGTFFELSLFHFTRVSLGHNMLYSNPSIYTRCLSTNEKNKKPFIMCSNIEKELVAMLFFPESQVPNTGIIPIKELPYTNYSHQGTTLH